MWRSAHRTFIGAATVLAAIVGLIQLQTTTAADAVPDSEFKFLVEQDAKNILALLKNGKPVRKTADRGIKSNAMMIAYYANSRMSGKSADDDAKLATLRDTAVKVAQTGGKKKYLKALAPAKLLAPNMAAGGKGEVRTMTIADLVKSSEMDMEELMYQYKKTSIGGLGIEEEIKANAKKATMTPAKIAAMSARILAVADYCDVLEPSKGFNAKNPKKDWDDYNKQTRDDVKALQAVAGGKDTKKIQSAFLKLDGACTACHDKFK